MLWLVDSKPMTRVLIADDQPRTRHALRSMLALRSDFELVGEAANGEEAIAAVERLKPAVVIMDLRLPRLDGIAATARIKARWPAVRVVVHSLADELRSAALDAGADAFVAKGAPISELLSALASAGD